MSIIDNLFGNKRQKEEKKVVQEEKKKELKQEENVKEQSNETVKQDVPKKQDEGKIVIDENIDVYAQKAKSKADEKGEKKIGSTIFTSKTELKRNLYIFLIEDTADTVKLKNRICKAVKRSSDENFTCFIHYGKTIEGQEEIDYTKIYFPYEVAEQNIVPINDKGDSYCFYDAIFQIQKIITKYHSKKYEDKDTIYTLEDVVVIGIGKGQDNCSKKSEKEAIEELNMLSCYPYVKTKYLALSEDVFVHLAKMGFHSIGALDPIQ